MSINTATTSDIPQLIQLINSAYRGESSKKGWATEAALVSGEVRIETADLEKILQDDKSVLLKYTSGDKIIGCVHLQKQDKGLYLGLLTVDPLLQAGGVGKQLLKASEDIAKEKDCPCIFMTVIEQRDLLVDWYVRHGYQATGESKPFIIDEKYGIPSQPLNFIVLKKMIV